MGEDRRHSERVAITFPVVCDDGDAYSDGTVLDLSLGGCFVHTRKLFAVGTDVTVSPVGDASDRVFEMHARVVRTVESETKENPPGMGLQFTRMKKSAYRGLKKLFDEMPATSGDAVTDLPPEKRLSGDEIIRARVRIRARRR